MSSTLGDHGVVAWASQSAIGYPEGAAADGFSPRPAFRQVVTVAWREHKDRARLYPLIRHGLSRLPERGSPCQPPIPRWSSRSFRVPKPGGTVVRWFARKPATRTGRSAPIGRKTHITRWADLEATTLWSLKKNISGTGLMPRDVFVPSSASRVGNGSGNGKGPYW